MFNIQEHKVLMFLNILIGIVGIIALAAQTVQVVQTVEMARMYNDHDVQAVINWKSFLPAFIVSLYYIYCCVTNWFVVRDLRCIISCYFIQLCIFTVGGVRMCVVSALNPSL